jgi:hypothetical protein
LCSEHVTLVEDVTALAVIVSSIGVVMEEIGKILIMKIPSEVVRAPRKATRTESPEWTPP